MQDRRIDARARIATVCAVLSVLSLSIVVRPGFGLCFGAFGVVFALSCVLDDGVGRYTRLLALAALLVSAVVIVAAVVVLYRQPVGGE